MRAIVQRVSAAEVAVDGEVIGRCGHGLALLVGVHRSDFAANAKKLAERVVNLRIFNDEGGKMNLSVLEVGGSVLAVSNFTVYGDTTSRRPGYSASAPFDVGKDLFDVFVGCLQAVVPTETGVFGADMQVTLTNDGPVTVIVDG